MKTKSVYRLAIEIVIELVKKNRSLRPVLALFGKKGFFECKYYVTLVDYIRYCRGTHQVIHLNGWEF